MNVFTTRDGKVYKVSLKNFVKATNKKAPYYRRVKVKGKTVEKAYAICPACGNPVYFVNLFNANKKKKAHARHQRSSVRNLAKYNALAYQECPFVKDEAKNLVASGASQKVNAVPKAFIKAMSSAFGYDEEMAKLLGAIYYKLQKKCPSSASQMLFAYMASASYNNASLIGIVMGEDSGTIKDVGIGGVWNAIAGIRLDDEVKKSIVSLGFKEKEINNLFAQIRDQHNSLNDDNSSYCAKTDFTHFCATVATILSTKNEKYIGDFASAFFNGIASADDNAGYIGDLCGTDGTDPSINDGDYKADLDAVNIASLLQKDPDVSLLTVLADYFNGLRTKEINRAQEFEKNVGIENLKNQRNAYALQLEQKDTVLNFREGPFLFFDDAKKDSMRESRIALFDKFIECIEQGKEEWPDE